MQEKSIIELIEDRLDHGGIDLPVFHRIASKLQRLLKSDNYSAADIVKIVSKDQAIASQVLKMSNSAFYAGLKPSKTIREAVIRLGLKSIINLAAVASQNRFYRSKIEEYDRMMNPLWSHALGVAVGARWLSLHLGLDRLAEEAFLAGLLHDIGKLLLLKILEELYEGKQIPESMTNGIVIDILEDMHCRQGERLMHHLNMPQVYCEVVGKHHDDAYSGDNVILNLVSLSNLTCHKLGIGLREEPGIMLSTTAEAMSLMASDMLLAELQVQLDEYKDSVQKVLRRS